MKKTTFVFLFFYAFISNAQITTELLISNKPKTEISKVTFYNNKCYAELKEDSSKYWLWRYSMATIKYSIYSIVEIDKNTLAYNYILKRDTNEVASDIVFQNTGSKLYCYYLSYKIQLKKIYLQKILINNNFVLRDSVLINLPIDQYGNISLYYFLRFNSKVILANNEVFSKIVYAHDTTQVILMNIQRFDTALTSQWSTDIKSVDATIYNNNAKTIIYYFGGQPKMNIKIYDKLSQIYTVASNPIFPIFPLNNASLDFIHWNQKDYMMIINDSNNDEVIDNTYLFSFINDSSFLLEKTFSGGQRVQCFNENDSLMYFVLGNDSINYLSIYNTSFSLINSGQLMRNKNGNRVVINNYKKSNPDYWYFGSYYVYPNYYPYVTKTSFPLNVKDQNVAVGRRVRIFPNPVKNLLTIETGDNKLIQVRILDLNGSLIYHDNSGNQTINISYLSSGLYFINAYTSEGVVLKEKFFKL